MLIAMVLLHISTSWRAIWETLGRVVQFLWRPVLDLFQTRQLPVSSIGHELKSGTTDMAPLLVVVKKVTLAVLDCQDFPLQLILQLLFQ